MTDADGREEPSDLEDHDAEPLEVSPAPAEIEELSKACLEYVQRAVGMELDGSSETLPILDHYLSMVRETADGRPSLVPLIGRAVGAYFGEVARRHFGGSWLLPDADAHHWLVGLAPVYLSFNPVGVAYDALFARADHDGPSSELKLAPEEREVVERRLGALPEMTETDYFRLSTRLEVLEIAVEALRAELHAEGRSDVVFEAGDYEGELELDK
ncbi:MAG: hypothetical protein OZ921_00470 [Sorangiineae bacterium]|nr:hypothetical protein [Polyangiaceae bacterium]MEB2320956.1 hypothetical protein [Sorangiineae bacterium]